MIKLTYLAHSSFLLECGATRLVFDPWLKGSAYFKQWYLWPLPPENFRKLEVDAILISHGHEDHLHKDTLKTINKNAHFFFPFQWRNGIKPFIEHIGFTEITEAISFRTYHVNDVKITYIGFSLESVVVVEYNGEVLVNINDALNSNHENAVNFILKELQNRWPEIDYLLSGWSGASYFPNQIRYPGKNDKEIAQLREQYFANNFLRFTNILQPGYSIPFAPGFILLSKQNAWINHVKFPRSRIAEYYTTHFKNTGKTKFLVPYPGDIIANGNMEKKSHLHEIPDSIQYDNAYGYYENEMKEAEKIETVSEDKIDELVEKLKHWTNYNKVLYHPKVIADTVFSIRLEDAQEETYINIRWDKTEFMVSRDTKPYDDRRVMVTTSAKKILYGLSKTWGGDVLTIGYGLIVEVYEQLTLEKNLDIVCIRLMTRYPMARKDLVKFPFRALKFYTANPRLTSLWLKQKIALKPYVNKYPYNERDHWMTYNKCDLCAVCKMPEINLQ
ncbi:MAG: MBL fold metallo-hydrolase [Bacteroidia bacterium]